MCSFVQRIGAHGEEQRNFHDLDRRRRGGGWGRSCGEAWGRRRKTDFVVVESCTCAWGLLLVACVARLAVLTDGVGKRCAGTLDEMPCTWRNKRNRSAVFIVSQLPRDHGRAATQWAVMQWIIVGICNACNGSRSSRLTPSCCLHIFLQDQGAHAKAMCVYDEAIVLH